MRMSYPLVSYKVSTKIVTVVLCVSSRELPVTRKLSGNISDVRVEKRANNSISE